MAVLDGLRAMAAILVLLAHTMQKWFIPWVPLVPLGSIDLAAVLRNGWSGVDLFFVLSGFLITRQLLEIFLDTGPYRLKRIGSYFRRRFCRIVPAYYLVLTITTISLYYRGTKGLGLSYLVHLLFLDNIYGQEWPFFWWPIFWSLAVEAQFYLLAPFLVAGLLRISRREIRYTTIVVSILVLASLRVFWAVYFHIGSDWFFKLRTPLPFSLDSLLAGMLCSFLWHDDKCRLLLQQQRVSNALFLGGLIAFFLATGLRPPHEAEINLYDKAVAPLCLAFAFSAMMMGLLSGSLGKGVFSSRPLRFVATVSYGTYLLHPSLMPYVYDRASTLIPIVGLNVAFLAGFAGIALVTLFFATVMYELVERRFITWAKEADKGAAKDVALSA